MHCKLFTISSWRRWSRQRREHLHGGAVRSQQGASSASEHAGDDVQQPTGRESRTVGRATSQGRSRPRAFSGVVSGERCRRKPVLWREEPQQSVQCGRRCIQMVNPRTCTYMYATLHVNSLLASSDRKNKYNDVSTLLSDPLRAHASWRTHVVHTYTPYVGHATRYREARICSYDYNTGRGDGRCFSGTRQFTQAAHNLFTVFSSSTCT